MRGIAEEIGRLGASVTLIGNGSPEQGREYSRDEKLPFRLLVDPELTTYEAAELRRSVLAGTGPRTPFRFFRALRQGFRPGAVAGNPYQMGGLFIIVPGGEVCFSQVSNELGDEPPMSEILAVLRTCPPGGQGTSPSSSGPPVENEPNTG